MFDSNFQILNQKIIPQLKDYSGLCFEKNTNIIWLISDESRLLVRWNLITDKLDLFNIPVEKAEGIAYHPFLEKIFIVSDKSSKLFIFNIADL